MFALTPGARLGPYDILSTLGIGGMGEVYRARDAKLNRDVAIKVLPFRNGPRAVPFPSTKRCRSRDRSPKPSKPRTSRAVPPAPPIRPPIRQPFPFTPPKPVSSSVPLPT